MLLNLKTTLIFALIFFQSGFVYADSQDRYSSSAITKNEINLSFGGNGNFFGGPGYTNKLVNFIAGKPVKDGIVYLPFGMHTKSKNKDITNNGLLGGFYNSIGFGTFVNSFDDRTWYLVSAHNVISYNGFGLDYFAGIMYG